jgi:hypothetical protein
LTDIEHGRSLDVIPVLAGEGINTTGKRIRMSDNEPLMGMLANLHLLLQTFLALGKALVFTDS